MQPLDRIRSPGAAPLAWRQTGEGKQAFAGFLNAVRDGAMLEPPLADEGLAAGFDLLVQALGRVGQQVPVLVDRAAPHRHAVPDGGDRFVETQRAIDDEELRLPQPAFDEIVGIPPLRAALSDASEYRTS